MKDTNANHGVVTAKRPGGAKRRLCMLPTTALTAILGISLWPSAASAQEFGSQGTAALGAERLMGINFSSASADDADVSTTTVSLLGASDFVDDGVFSAPYTTPRFTFDYFVAERFSVGGGLVYATRSGEIDANGFNADLEDVSFFGIFPRAGYALGLSHAISLWIRGGITYYSISANDGDDTLSGLGLNVDGMFAISPADHFAITVGPVIDLGLTGTAEDTNADTEQDVTINNFGLSAGLVGYF